MGSQSEQTCEDEHTACSDLKPKDGQSRVSHHATSKDVFFKNNTSSQEGSAKILKSLLGDIISRKRSLVSSLWDITVGKGRKHPGKLGVEESDECR